MKKKVIVTSVLAALLIGCVTASAFSAGGMFGKGPMHKGGKHGETQSFVEGFVPPSRPYMPELTEEQKAEMQEKALERLNKQLENGEITQEEYDTMLTAIENGEFRFGGKRPGRKPMGKPGSDVSFKKDSEAYEKPPVPELTEEQKAEMKEKAIEKLNKELENGKITQEEYENVLEAIENGEFASGFRGKKGGPRGHFKPDREKFETPTEEASAEE